MPQLFCGHRKLQDNPIRVEDKKEEGMSNHLYGIVKRSKIFLYFFFQNSSVTLFRTNKKMLMGATVRISNNLFTCNPFINQIENVLTHLYNNKLTIPDVAGSKNTHTHAHRHIRTHKQ